MPKGHRNILVVDDEPKIIEVIASFLENRGFTVFSSDNGRDAMEIFNRENIALVVLDLMLPDISGEEICLAIRRKSRVPIVMLTAKAGESNLLKGLDIGADDYISKPFSLKELTARIEAILRRSGNELIPLTVKSSWGDGDLIIDFEKRIVLKRHEAVSMTTSEFNVLSALIKYPGKVFTRGELIEIALSSKFDGYDRTVDSHIKNIRHKIEDDPKSPKYILTIYGLGYKFGGD